MHNETTTAAPVVEKVKTTVEPIKFNGQQLYVRIRGAQQPCVQKTTPEHYRKVQGSLKKVEQVISFTIAIDSPMGVLALAQAALLEAPEAERLQLAERIFGNWLDSSAARGYVPSQTEPGQQEWDEVATAKALCQATTPRKSGTSIEDLRKEREDINSIMVPLLEFIMVATSSDDEPNWAEIESVIGRKFTETEAMIEYRVSLKEKLQNLTASIKVKEESINKSKAKRAAKKAAAPAPAAASNAAPEPNVQY